jgi:hypothetical protein
MRETGAEKYVLNITNLTRKRHNMSTNKRKGSINKDDFQLHICKFADKKTTYKCKSVNQINRSKKKSLFLYVVTVSS